MLAGVVTIGKPFPHHGGFNAAIKKIAQWEQDDPASNCASPASNAVHRPMTITFHLRLKLRANQ